MGLNDTPRANRPHIGFFGRRNAGKSSLLNAVTNQDISVVSEYAGTTTDPVSKAMEMLPAGPVVVIDTPGFDDVGELGELRVKKTKQVLNKTDAAILVCDALTGLTDCDRQLISLFKSKNIPYIAAYTKCDLAENIPQPKENEIYVSSKTGRGINELKDKIASLISVNAKKQVLVSDLVNAGDLIILVVPIDSSAPLGRLILPQQQTIRDGLDSGAQVLVVRDTELKGALSDCGKKPSLVITDSQAFGKVMKTVPEDIPLTSFSILMARNKGFLKNALEGAQKLDTLSDGDRVLICEGCTHHRQCEDIGTVKLPKWISEYSGKRLEFEFTSGTGFPEDLSGYALIVHCGGCMLTERDVRHRMLCASDAGIPFTNYGTAIAKINGILSRSVEPLHGKLTLPR